MFAVRHPAVGSGTASSSAVGPSGLRDAIRSLESLEKAKPKEKLGPVARDTRCTNARSRESSAACSRGAGSRRRSLSRWMAARLKFLTLGSYPGGAAACTCALAASICSSACISGTLIIMCDACVPSPPPAASAASALTPGYGTGGRAARAAAVVDARVRHRRPRARAAAVVDAEQQARRCSSSRALVTSPA